MFNDILKEQAEKSNIELTQKQMEDFTRYYELLVEWNEKMNLTALTDETDVALKHFCDSVLLLKYADIPENSSLIDVGTGAGFPSVPLKIMRPDMKLCLLDSLNKRLVFLKEVVKELNLQNVEIVHSRAEDGAKNPKLREQFDFATSRAVAQLNVLTEYCLPYVKVGGSFLAMKGKYSEEEIANAKCAIKTLGGKTQKVSTYNLADSSERTIINVKKVANTDKKYPRTSAKIKAKPL
ncbi:MAG: 16S rRNA (guanine(527)-N(7))-methyltransferase RsmG [Ruminococcaceae bacterium]|nr:16S rRNA (guanine(527)-N(7))-methyltransferase RsmG [Oscillospiraceae bacterium]